MGNSKSLPDRINEAQAKELAGELWNQFIFDALVADDGLADKKDVVDAASEALMAFQGESIEIMRVTSRRKKSTSKQFKTNQEFAKSIYESQKARRNGPELDICRMVHMGQLEDVVSICELADPDILNSLDPKLDKTALHVASLYGFQEICKYLIDKGCNVNVVNKEKKTALHLAAQIGNWDVVCLLMDSGADTDHMDFMGRYPGDYVESDYSCEGFVKQDASRFAEMTELLTPRDPKHRLYKGPRTATLNDPPSAEVVAVELNTDSFQVGTNGQGLHRTSVSINSDSSSHSMRRTVIGITS